jgi:hypothetical protein
MLELAGAIAIGLLGWQGANYLLRRFRLRGLLFWVGVWAVALLVIPTLLILIGNVVVSASRDTVLLLWLVPLGIALVFSCAVVVGAFQGWRENRRQRHEGAISVDPVSKREVIAALEAEGMHNAPAAFDAFVTWYHQFIPKYGRDPSTGECSAWKVRWQELHGVGSSLKPSQSSSANAPMLVSFATGKPAGAPQGRAQ